MPALLSLGVVLLASVAGAQDYPVPAPRPPATQVRVGAYIFPGWETGRGDEYGEWKLIAKFAHPRPVLGFYDQSLPEVNDWQIKWALDAGISWFAFDWYYYGGEKHLHRTLEDGFLQSRYGEQIDFCIHWCNHPVEGWPPLDYSPAALRQMVSYCAETYFNRPNYLRIGQRPVFMIWDIKDLLKAVGGPEVFSTDILPSLNTICHAKGLGDLFIVLVSNSPDAVAQVPVGDAFTGYSFAGLTTETPFSRPGSAPYREMVEALPDYLRRMHEASKPFITCTHSGWDDMPRTLGWGNDTRWARPGNTPELFEQTLRDCKPLVKPELPLLVIEAWNEWGEGSFIEPSKEMGFGQLEAIRRVFSPDAGPVEWPVPSQAQIDSYSILQGETLRAARERETQPDPPPVVADWPVWITLDPPELPGEVVAEIDFSSPDSIARVTGRHSMDPPHLDGGTLVSRISDSDPQLYFAGDWGPLRPGSSIAFRLRYSGTVNPHAQLFWATDGGQLSEDSSRRHLWLRDAEWHTYVFTFRDDRDWSGVLTQFRLDPPDGPGEAVRLQWVKLLAPQG